MKKISSFSVILIMIVLMIIGAAMIPLLNIQYSPTSTQQQLSINYSWSGASARVIEQEVTSKIEGVLAPISGVQKMNSESYKDGGSITLIFKDDANMDAIRFEVSSKIRQVYNSLPKGVRYPSLSTSTSGEYTPPILIYTINADLPTWQIQQYAEKNLAEPLSRINGVKQVDVTGATPFEWVVTFDPDLCATAQISGNDIYQAIQNQSINEPLGLGITESGEQIRVTVKGSELKPDRWDEIVVKNSHGRLITLGDVATIKYQQSLPRSYYRLNGLNNINMGVTPEKHTNTLVLTSLIKQEVEKLRTSLPEGYSVSLVGDSSVYIQKELTKIYFRSGLSLLILLLFVFLVSRSVKYLMLIVVTLLANILIAFILYNLFNLEIHLYSLAGITVSLGLIIDTSIIMTDYYGRYRNLRVFVAILAALLTTIGALSIVLFLPEEQRANLADFSAVIIINLSVSMFVSLFFIPALLDRFPMRTLNKRHKSSKWLRMISRISSTYLRCIYWGKRHKIVYILIFVLAFGIPVQLLPPKLGVTEFGQKQDTLTEWQELYNKTIGGELYQQKVKPWLEPALGGSMRLFAKSAFSGGSFWSDPQRTTLHINASLPEGCTVHQLNETVLDMENFLSQYSEIESFQTRVNSYSNASITVTFKPEAEKMGFAYTLKDAATSKAISLGGATWGVYGVGHGFSNSMGGGYKQNQIRLTGYNYEQLYKYAQNIVDTISQNPRVKEPEIAGRITWGGSVATEFFLDFNFERFALYGISPSEYYDVVEQQLFRNSMPSIYNDGQMENVVLVSAGAQKFDAWHLSDDILKVGDMNVKLSALGSISKRRSGNNIYKNDQQYTLTVAFDFVGSYELAKRFTERQIKRVSESLPIGFRVETSQNDWWGQNSSTQYSLLLLVIVIIYFICAVLFESLLQPLVIIAMIPISFIGLFLTFWLFELHFDQGGFASLVLLCGLVVNAGIYIINEYNQVGNYIRAFNRKIIPITLTVLSTVLGLIPFVVISREPFWFSFASGAMGGMMFSIIAIVVLMPIFLRIKNKR